MRVLFVNPAWDAAGVSIRQARAISKYTNWQARHFRAVRTFNYDTDITPDNYNRDEFVQIIRESDVIHFCSATHTYTSSHVWGFNWEQELKGKIKIFHDYCSFPGGWRERAKAKDYWNKRQDIGYDAIFSSIPQAIHIYDGCIYIPDIVDEKSSEFDMNTFRDYHNVTIGHFPTGGGNNKNTMELRKGIEIAVQKYPVKAIIETDLPHEHIIRRKKMINLGFDALWREYHGMTTVENLALGVPTMCNICPEFDKVFREFFQTDFYPFERVRNINEIAERIVFYSENLGILEERGKAVRKFMQETWSAKNVVTRIVQEYEKLLARK
jgi:hypothetical protein